MTRYSLTASADRIAGALRPVAIMLIGTFVVAGVVAEPITPEPLRFIGTVKSLKHSHLTIKTLDDSIGVFLTDSKTVFTRRDKASFSDIQSGDFVASANVQQPDGKTHAQEVRIFPIGMRGMGEGDRPMAGPDTESAGATVTKIAGATDGAITGRRMMTDATVTKIASGVLTMSYPGGTKEITVDSTTPVWRISPVERRLLVNGAPVFVVADRASDGTLKAKFVALQQ